MISLVLLPGMDGSGKLFHSLVDELGEEFSISVVEYPPDQPLDYSELTDIAREAIPANGPVVLLGESFSGPIAVRLAVEMQSRLLGLILCCSFLRNPHPATHYLRYMVDWMPFSSRVAGSLADLFLGRYGDKSLRQALSGAIEPVTASTLRSRMKSVLDVDVRDEFSRIEKPVLYLRASHDLLVPTLASARILNRNPSVELVELDAPHFLLQTAPCEAAEIIQDFIRRVSTDH